MELKWRIGEDSSEPGVTCIRKFFVDSSGLIFLPKTRKVKVYSPDGTFSFDIVLESDSDSTGIELMVTRTYTSAASPPLKCSTLKGS